MADAMKLLLQRAHFGIAPPESTLTFSITPDLGFAVRAVLDCDTKIVGSWEWVELEDGQVIPESLIPKGTYTLTLHVAFTSDAPGTCVVHMSVGDTKRTRSLTGQKPDIGRVLAVVFIQ